MGQFSLEKPALPGSALSGNQQGWEWDRGRLSKLLHILTLNLARRQWERRLERVRHGNKA
jgi:hypothetical protein